MRAAVAPRMVVLNRAAPVLVEASPSHGSGWQVLVKLHFGLWTEQKPGSVVCACTRGESTAAWEVQLCAEVT